MLGGIRNEGRLTSTMNTSAKHASSASAAWLYLRRAMDAVSMATVQFPGTHLSAAARQEFAAEVSALMGGAELLLSTVYRDNQAHTPAAAPEAPSPVVRQLRPPGEPRHGKESQTMSTSTRDSGRLSRIQPVISAAGANEVLRAAEAKAAEIGIPVVVAVVDDAGDLKALIRMDGTPKGAIQWSVDKAITAASFRAPTHVLAQAMEGAPASALASFMAQPHVTLAPAGYPLVIDGVVAGAIGAGGGTPEQDQAVAQAGAAALGDA